MSSKVTLINVRNPIHPSRETFARCKGLTSRLSCARLHAKNFEDARVVDRANELSVYN